MPEEFGYSGVFAVIRSMIEGEIASEERVKFLLFLFIAAIGGFPEVYASSILGLYPPMFFFWTTFDLLP